MNWSKKPKIKSKIEKKSVAGHIEYWTTTGEIVEENPDLPCFFIKGILIGKEQAKSNLLSPYKFGEGK